VYIHVRPREALLVNQVPLEPWLPRHRLKLLLDRSDLRLDRPSFVLQRKERRRFVAVTPHLGQPRAPRRQDVICPSREFTIT